VLDVSKELGLEINAKTRMFKSLYHNAGKGHYIKTGNILRKCDDI